MKGNSQKQQVIGKRKLKLNKETIKDLKTDDKSAEKVKGGRTPCDDWGSGMNHNETLVRDSNR